MQKKEIDTVCTALAKLVADHFILYVKVLNFHWNMKSPQFYMYHKLLEEQYHLLQEIIDDFAERIRILERRPPSSMAEFLKLAHLKESQKKLSDQEMVEMLVSDYEYIVEEDRKMIALSDKVGDPATSDLVVGKMRAIDKAAWLLRSHISIFA